METVKISEVPKEWLSVAADMAKDFIERYPDKMGIYHGCAYSKAGSPHFYIYRVKSMVVVRGSILADINKTERDVG